MKLRPIAVAFFLVLSACTSGGSSFAPPSGGSAASAPNAAPATGAYAFAPYVDMTSWPPPQLAGYATATGTRYFTLAFVQSYKQQCRGAWGGQILPTDARNGPYFAQQLAAIRNQGGDGILSFGGAAGVDLAMTCTDAPSLAGAIEALVDYYHVTHLDFDVEGNGPYDAPSIARRSQALRMVQDHYASAGTTIVVSLTLPVLPSGLPGHVLGLVQSAVQAGVKVAIVNIMTMDFGKSQAPNPAGKMAAYSIQAATKTAAQLKTIGFPLGANPYASIGITPMIGVNDVPSEIFELKDASQLVTWAKQNGVGRLTFWAAQRDKTCPGGAKPHASDTCSSIVQPKNAFGKTFASF